MYKIKYSIENANIINKLVHIPDNQIINNLKIRSEYIEFKLVKNDPFLITQYLNEKELFIWFSMIEQLD